jgi:ankyrin repeat protein
MGKADYFAAITEGDLPQVRAYLDDYPTWVNSRNEQGLSAVLIAVYYQEPEIARLLVERGAELNLFEAAALGDFDRVRDWVEGQPALVNAFGADGYQPLGLACYFGREDVADLLLAAGANVQTPSDNPLRVTPLHSAAAGNHIAIVRKLVGRGADPNARAADGSTPLHSAAQNGAIEMVRFLIGCGSDPYARNLEGRSPIDLALEQGHDAVVRLVEDAG